MRKARMVVMILLALTALSVSAQQPGAHTPAPQSGPYSWSTGTYQYDASGNITTIGTWTFAYDPLNRLAASHVTTPPGAASDQTFTYDSFGNMALQPASSTQTNHLDPMMATYDEAGEVTQYHPPGSGHAYGFTYDAVGSITTESTDGVPTSYFVYNVDGERLRIESTSGTTHWRVRGLDQKVLRDFQLYGMSWSVSRDYIYRGQLLAAITPTTVENFSVDHLGSPRLISDFAGNEMARHTYLPFGQEFGVSTDGESLKFTGHERDENPADGAGTLDYMHARYYSAGTARFLSMDPFQESDMQKQPPQRWNKYSYVQNRPVILTDPSGKFELLFVMEGGLLDGLSRLIPTGCSSWGDTSQWDNALPHSSGFSFTETTDWGNAQSGVGQNGTVGVGIFSGYNPEGLHLGTFASWGGFANVGGVSKAFPQSDTQPYAVGGYAGVGTNFFVSNGRDQRDIRNGFKQFNTNWGLGSKVTGGAISWGRNDEGRFIYVISIGLPVGGGGGGAFSFYDTNTWVWPRPKP